MDISQQWGLPEGFQPVRHPIPDEAKNALRGRLEAGEPVIITIANDEDTVSIVATPQRMFTIKTGVGPEPPV